MGPLRRLRLAGPAAVLAGALAAGCSGAVDPGAGAPAEAFAPSGWTYLVAEVTLPGGGTPDEETLRGVMAVVGHRLDAEIPDHRAQLGPGRVEFAVPPDAELPPALDVPVSTDIQLRPVASVGPAGPGACPPPDGQQLCDHDETHVFVLEPDILPEDALSSATAEMDQVNGGWLVLIDLSPAGSDAFADWTTAHVGDQLAIVHDGVVLFAPMINEPIPGGTLQVAGIDQAEATLLEAEVQLAASGATWTVEPVGAMPPT